MLRGGGEFQMRFQKGTNPNKPKVGKSIKVEPIRKKSEIKRIRELLSKNPSHLCLFSVGINTGFRISDILQISVKMVKDLQSGGEISIKEKKTGKLRKVNLNEGVINDINRLLESKDYSDDDFLFTNQRGNVFTTPYVSTMVKGWCNDIGLKGNYASHSLRKTFGYHQRHTFGVSLPILVDIFNHSSQKQTLDYLCIQPEEKKSVYMNQL
jgi:integrase